MNTSLRAASLCLLAAALLPAQFRDLATTHDGSRLFFFSTLRQRGTDQPLFDKIFALDARGVSVFHELPVPGPNPWEQYSVGTLQAAGDGSWVLYGRRNNCIGGSSCFLNEQRTAGLVAGGNTEWVGPNARLSSDGRWLVAHNSPGVMMRFAHRVDRRTGARVDIPLPSGKPSVALNGAVLIPAFDRLLLWKDGESRSLAGGVEAAVMDDAATTVVYQTRGARHLRVVDIATGMQWPLGPDDRDNWAPVLSADGSFVLYLSRIGDTPQVFFSRRNGSEWRQLTALEAGVREATLSGDARTAWVLTGDGAVLRIDTATGVSEQRIAPTPSLETSREGAVGSAVVLTGTGFDAIQAVRIDGQPVTIQARSPHSMFVLIPWTFSPADTELAFDGGDPAFDAAFPFKVAEYAPAAAVIIHDDFGSLVTESNPARPGELLHIYASGLGPVGPPDPLSRTLLPWEWFWSIGGDTPAEVLYAGLAPGFTGWYQVELRVPETVDTPLLELLVRLTTPDGVWYRWGMGNIPIAR